MGGNFTVERELSEQALSKLSDSITQISNIKGKIEMAKNYPPEYEYVSEVESAISELNIAFRSIEDVYSKFSGFMSTSIKVENIAIANSILNYTIEKSATSKELTDYFNYLSSKNDLSDTEKKVYSTLYDHLKSKDINKFLGTADAVNKQLQDRGVTYSVTTGIYNDAKKSFSSNKTCCATYVSNVLHDYDSNTYSDERLATFNYNYCQTLYKELKKEMNEIKNINDLKAGDIVFMCSPKGNKNDIQHVQIYAGDNYWYNAGSTEAIYKGKYADTSQNYRFITALRPNYKNNEEIE